LTHFLSGGKSPLIICEDADRKYEKWQINRIDRSFILKLISLFILHTEQSLLMPPKIVLLDLEHLYMQKSMMILLLEVLN
jgi:hypothetical protein